MKLIIHIFKITKITTTLKNDLDYSLYDTYLCQ